jgi:hypothetical protein
VCARLYRSLIDRVPFKSALAEVNREKDGDE